MQIITLINKNIWLVRIHNKMWQNIKRVRWPVKDLKIATAHM